MENAVNANLTIEPFTLNTAAVPMTPHRPRRRITGMEIQYFPNYECASMSFNDSAKLSRCRYQSIEKSLEKCCRNIYFCGPFQKTEEPQCLIGTQLAHSNTSQIIYRKIATREADRKKCLVSSCQSSKLILKVYLLRQNDIAHFPHAGDQF